MENVIKIIGVLAAIATIAACCISLPSAIVAVRQLGESPTVVGRVSQSPTQDSLQLPKGYAPYGTFESQVYLDRDWWLDDGIKMCNLNVREGQLFFDCRNTTITDTVVTLHPLRQSSTITGVAVFAQVEKADGTFELATKWKCKADSSERAYHITIRPGIAYAREFYPQDKDRIVVLGETTIKTDEMHLLQIERSGDSVAFYVNSKPIPLNKTPNTSACFAMSDWVLDFYVWKDNNNVKGRIGKVGTRYIMDP